MGTRYWHGNEKGYTNRSDWQLYHGQSNSQYTWQVRLEVLDCESMLPNCVNFSFLFRSTAALVFSSTAVPDIQRDVLPSASCPSFALLTLIRAVPMTSTVRNWTPVLLICAAGVKAHKSPLLCSWSLKVQPTGSEAQLSLQTAEDGGG